MRGANMEHGDSTEATAPLGAGAHRQLADGFSMAASNDSGTKTEAEEKVRLRRGKGVDGADLERTRSTM
jgi:hypothetical protein